jgi:competence protein ComEC
MAALGAGMTVAAAHRAADPLPGLLAAWRTRGFEEHVVPVELQGRAIEVETPADGRVALLLRLERATLPGWEAQPIAALRAIVARVTFPVSDDRALPVPRPGDFVELTARIGTPRTFRNPGAFDYAAYLGARRIALVGSVKSIRLVRTDPHRRSVLAGFLPEIRRAVVAALGRAGAGQSEGTVALLSALLVGERDDLPADFQESLVRAGVYHIIALSGFNVALLAGIVSGLLRLLHVPPWSRRLLLGIVVLSYWAVARTSGSMSRAALMAILQIGGAALGRRVPGIGAMSSALVILLAAGPMWMDDAGFQLSFAATFGILVAAPAREAWGGGRTPPGAGIIARSVGAARRGLATSLRISAAALAGTALLSARHFQTLTPIALASNVIAVPLASALLVLSVGAALLEGFWHQAAAGLVTACDFMALGLERLCAAVALVPWGSFYVMPPSWSLVVLGLAALAGLAFGGTATRRAALALLLAAMALTAVRGRMPRPTGRLEIVVLDVGQGDAIVVRFPHGSTMLVDAGGFARSSFDVGARLVAPALRAMGILRLDVLAITHAHRDHLGGAPAIVRQLRPAAIWLGRMPRDDSAVDGLLDLAARLRIPVIYPRSGVRVGMGGSVVEVHNPGRHAGPASGVSNDDSLVLRLGLGARHALLTGDLEREGEATLAAVGRDLTAELLKIPHHGSRTSSTKAFLLRVRPRIAAISVGSANPWGHPDREVIDRLETEGIAIVRTDRDGAVRFSTNGHVPWTARLLTAEGDEGPRALRESERSE